jgi:hypothetical protein
MLPLGIDRANLDLDLALVRKADRLDRTKNAVLVDRVNTAHRDDSRYSYYPPILTPDLIRVEPPGLVRRLPSR